MNISKGSEFLSKFRRTPWKFQTTFATPLRALDFFVSEILLADERLESCSVTIDEVALEPRHLKALLTGCPGSPEIQRNVSFSVEGKEKVRELLVAAFADPVDFLFVPVPKPFIIYADHDEYTTFYANTKSNLNLVAERLKEKKFERVADYQREF